MSAPMLPAFLVLIAAPSASAGVMSVLAPTDGGLTIEEVIDRSVATSGVIKRADVEYQRSASDRKSAYLLYVPRVDLSASYGRQSRIDAPPEFGAFQVPNESLAAVANISIPASDYVLRIIHAYDAATYAEEAARLTLESQKDVAAYSAVTIFIQSVRARAAEVVTRASVETLAQQVEDLEAQAGAGLVTPGDVLQLRAQLSFAKVENARAAGALHVLEESLRRTLHDDRADLRHGEALIANSTAPLPTKDEALADAMTTRPEFKALAKVTQMREMLVRVERARVFPRLTVDANAVHAKPNQQVFFDPQTFHTTWNLTVNLRWSPNDAVSGWSAWGKADRELSGIAADLLALEDAVTVEVSEALTSYDSARRLLAAVNDGLEAAEGAFEDRKNLVAAGQAPTTELVLSQQALRDAQLQLINVHLDIRLARARLDRALGRLRQGDAR